MLLLGNNGQNLHHRIVQSTGYAVINLVHLIPSIIYQKWVLKPKNVAQNIFYIYNEDQQGYSNTYGNKDSQKNTFLLGKTEEIPGSFIAILQLKALLL